MADSYSRLQALLDCQRMPEFWGLVQLHWSLCDNIWQHTPELKKILRAYSGRHAYPIRGAMSPQERAAYKSLPGTVTVWRGCYQGVNDDGLSWSLSKDVAMMFPTLRRYGHATGAPVVVEGRVRRDRIAFLSSERAEDEVVVLPEDVTRVHEHQIPRWVFGPQRHGFHPLLLRSSGYEALLGSSKRACRRALKSLNRLDLVMRRVTDHALTIAISEATQGLGVSDRRRVGAVVRSLIAKS